MIDFHSQIPRFLAGKKLSQNSQQAYTYDLEQFCQQVGPVLDEYSLRLYREGLANLKPTAQKRKLSAVNQFLYFLYDEELVNRFYKLPLEKVPHQESHVPQLMDWSILYEATPFPVGRLLALLMVELGMTPSEIAALEIAKIDTEFRVITMTKGQTVRILPLPESLLPYLEWSPQQVYLFDHNGHPYSRQWLFKQLKVYLEQIDRSNFTAQTLREQFVLAEIAKGTVMMDLAKKLGLKTPVTLEKYYRHGH